MSSASRTPYNSETPERSSFSLEDIPLGTAQASSALSPRTSFIPTPARSGKNATVGGTRGQVQGRWARFAKKAKATWKNNTGMLLIAASQAFMSLMNVIVKELNSLDNPVPAFELIWVRMTITWICCIAYMTITKVPDPFLGPKGVRLLLALRGFVGFFGLFGVYYSLQYLSLSDATVLTFLAPLCTCVTGAVFLGEKLHWKQGLAGLFALFGVMLIARPDFLFASPTLHEVEVELNSVPALDGNTEASVTDIGMGGLEVTPARRLAAVGVALIGVCGATGAYTTLRAIGKRAHPMHSLVAFSSLCVVVSSIGMIATRSPIVLPTRWLWGGLLLLIGIFGFLGQLLLTMGLQRETAGRGTMAVYVQIVFATIFERVFFHTSPPFLSIIGTIIIIIAAVYVAVTKEDTGAHKRARSLANPMEDISLEEGLLANEEELVAENAEKEPENPAADSRVTHQGGNVREGSGNKNGE